MTTIALELPENISQWPAWLEKQIVGTQLRQLVMQLEVIAGTKAKQTTSEKSTVVRLRELIGNDLPAVLNSGLNALSHERLKTLVQQPRLLLALQEVVFTEGGTYWQTVPRAVEHSQAADGIRKQLLAQLSHEPSPTVAPLTSATSQVQVPTMSNSVRPNETTDTTSARRSWLVLASLAAAVMFMFFLWQSNFSSGRYFARAGLLTSSQKDNAFAKLMATAVQEDWQPASQPNRLEHELTALRDSCDLALSASLSQLEPTVAADFKKRCEKWRDVFSECLNELKSGKPEKDVYEKANATVQKLVTVLNELG